MVRLMIGVCMIMVVRRSAVRVCVQERCVTVCWPFGGWGGMLSYPHTSGRCHSLLLASVGSSLHLRPEQLNYLNDVTKEMNGMSLKTHPGMWRVGPGPQMLCTVVDNKPGSP